MILIAFGLSACAQVYFSTPQPQKGSTVKTFLEELTGVYADSILDITIDSDAISISGDRFEMTRKTPGDHQVLVKYYRDFYFASFKDSTFYSVFMGKFYDDKLAVYMLNGDELSLNRLNRLIKVDTIDAESNHYLVNPSKKEFDNLLDYEMFEVVSVLQKIK